MGWVDVASQLELVHEVKMAIEEPWAVRERVGGGVS